MILDGATSLYPIVGDPIKQVKSPQGVTELLQAAGLNALCVPAHVRVQDFDLYMQSLAITQNVAGVIITVPHKFSAYNHCKTATDRAHFLKAANVLRRNDDGSWHGDMCDGEGCVQAMKQNGADFKNKNGLLIGAGGAGSAIAYAALKAGLSTLSIVDNDEIRRNTLITALKTQGFKVKVGGEVKNHAIIINATPMGMKEQDPLPFDVQEITAHHFVGDVITQPIIPKHIELVRLKGAKTSTGSDMFQAVRGLMMGFFIPHPK